MQYLHPLTFEVSLRLHQLSDSALPVSNMNTVTVHMLALRGCVVWKGEANERPARHRVDARAFLDKADERMSNGGTPPAKNATAHSRQSSVLASHFFTKAQPRTGETSFLLGAAIPGVFQTLKKSLRYSLCLAVSARIVSPLTKRKERQGSLVHFGALSVIVWFSSSEGRAKLHCSQKGPEI